MKVRYFGGLAFVGMSIAVLAGCGGGGGTSSGSGSPPTVLAVFPIDMDTAAPKSKRIIATFSEEMDAGSFTQDSMIATTPSGRLDGTVSCTAATGTLLLNNPLPGNTDITVTIAGTVRSEAGRALSSPYTWTFKTVP